MSSEEWDVMEDGSIMVSGEVICDREEIIPFDVTLDSELAGRLALDVLGVLFGLDPGVVSEAVGKEADSRGIKI